MKRKFTKVKDIILLVACDFASITLAMLLALLIVHNGDIPWSMDILYLYISELAATYIFFSLFRLYSIVFTSVGLWDTLKAIAAGSLILATNVVYIFMYEGGGWRYSAIFSVLLVLFALIVRFSKRIYVSIRYVMTKNTRDRIRLMVVGGGEAGTMLIREIQTTDKINYLPICVVDDDLSKKGRLISNVKIVGDTSQIPEFAKKYAIDEIVIAIPAAARADIARIHSICKQTDCKVKILPGIYQIVSGSASVSALREVRITDLLGRDEVRVNPDEIMGYIENQVVLVTGGGGSIGSELCRQIASRNPRQLIILDIYENNAYDIEQELKRRYPNLNLLALIASVRDRTKIEDVFKTYKPAIVFNAAAHKHVPLMETSPNEAVKNNVFGTLNVAQCADKYGAKTFVQISTDKAVNPTNVMGATKRICEMIIQTIGRHSQNTNFVAVRFGNVLGSNGSVIPLFEKQIAEGGPVTVTHKDIIRYFMTIPEAVMLVLQAGAYAKGGQIFVLDMGEPVKIYDLAVNLIRLSGLEPGVDIEIKCTGLRPGEKLYEERLMDEEGLQKTDNGLINIAQPIQLDEEKMWACLAELKEAAAEETDHMRELIAKLVPTYKPH